MGGTRLDVPIVGMAAAAAVGGYWEVAADGGVFGFDTLLRLPLRRSWPQNASSPSCRAPGWRVTS